MNEPVKDGNFEFVVTGGESGSPLVDKTDPNLTLPAPEGQTFFVVHITVKNVGTEAQPFTAAAQVLHAGGQAYEYYTDASTFLANPVDPINPGDQIEVAVAFVAPSDANPDTIELHDVPFSTGAVVNFPK